MPKKCIGLFLFLSSFTNWISQNVTLESPSLHIWGLKGNLLVYFLSVGWVVNISILCWSKCADITSQCGPNCIVTQISLQTIAHLFRPHSIASCGLYGLIWASGAWLGPWELYGGHTPLTCHNTTPLLSLNRRRKVGFRHVAIMRCDLRPGQCSVFLVCWPSDLLSLWETITVSYHCLPVTQQHPAPVKSLPIARGTQSFVRFPFF